MQPIKSLKDLIDEKDPGRAVLDSLLEEAQKIGRMATVVLPVDDQLAADKTLEMLQVTTRSMLGAVAYTTGGLLFDGGWLRVRGAGSRSSESLRGSLRGLLAWNQPQAPPAPKRFPGAVLIADDVVGGVFAINGGGISRSAADLGRVFYHPPGISDGSLGEWENLDIGFSDFIRWLVVGTEDDPDPLAVFYRSERWTNWQEDVSKLPLDQFFHFYPPIGTEPDMPMERRSRKPVPIDEIL